MQDLLIGPVTARWRIPAPRLLSNAETHFAARAVERGAVETQAQGAALKWLVEECVRSGRAGLAAHVFDICDRASIYRIRLPRGVFFAVVSRDRAPVAMTIYTRAEIRAHRAGRRRRLRLRGRRDRGGAA